MLVIENNSAGNGGGVYDSEILGGGTVVCGNRASDAGGGIRLPTGSAKVVRGALIYGNAAQNSGGGAYYGNLVNCVVSNNTLAAANGCSGAGLSYTVATNCDVCFNYIPATSSSTGTRCGAGASNAVLTDCRIFGNSIFPGGGSRQGCGAYGGAYTNCTFYNNYGPSVSGVGLNGGRADGCVFSNNVSQSAGRFAVRQPSGPITNCRIYGGWVASTTQPFVNCVFTGQESAGYFLPAGASVANPTNDISSTRSGSSCLFCDYVNLRNCLVCGMTGYDALFCASENYTTTIENCTFVSNHFNTTFKDFTGSADYPKPAVVRNTIFVNNTQSGNRIQRDLWYASGENNICFTNCLIGTVRPETPPVSEYGTVTTDNAKFDWSDGAPRYSIRNSSPARGKGVVQDWMADASDIRGIGYPRLRDGAVDIGCYQCWLPIPGMLILFR